MIDYQELLNFVERHITCNERSCFRKKSGRLVCRYKAPWIYVMSQKSMLMGMEKISMNEDEMMIY